MKKKIKIKHFSTGISDDEREERQEILRELYEKGIIDISYKDYINSYYWKRKKIEFFEKLGKKCSVCGSESKLQIHHKHYRSLGKETEEDVVICCLDCHKELHNQLAKEKRKKGIKMKNEIPKKLIKEVHDRVMKERYG